MSGSPEQERPRISVQIPAYNAGSYLERALRSIATQTFADFEVLVADDRSSDDTRDIAEAFAAQDPRFRVLDGPGAGSPSACRNALLDATHPSAPFIALMDADDICAPTRLEKELAFLDAHPDIAFVGSAIRYIDDDDCVIGERPYPTDPDEVFAKRLKANPFAQPSVLIRRDVLLGARYDETQKTLDDYGLWLRLLDQYRGANLAEPLLDYRFVPSAKAKKAGATLRAQIPMKIRHARTREWFSLLPLRLAAEAALSLMPGRVTAALFARSRGIRSSPGS